MEDGNVSLSRKFWAEYEKYDEFLHDWMQMEHTAHNLNFLSHLNHSPIHPVYLNCVRNGRTSCRGPALQQTPRTGGFRELFRASEGHVFVTIDYNFIELCTLAAVCEYRYGKSVLADVIRAGRDPHAFTAAMFHHIPFEEFLEWRDSDDAEKRKTFKVAIALILCHDSFE